ncbi:hypothetical protein HPB52_015750 [Rhipicephalus sanguineus]|uniref:Pre-mRNA-splicing factor SYF1 n=1 Tax=Rhipicephalus sanguineus TaxID=34632 RepID=A0A9D4YQE5_RHISA|nr:hypothetical protein HPB52_015750 [Rhipicephalus sanguineus]
MKSTKDIVFEEDDLPYEEEIIRNPFSVKHWIRYIDYKKDQPKHVINLICERALRELPGSYKLWYNYLKLRRQQVRDLCITDPEYEDVNSAFERSLVFMHKMPRIWMDYCKFLTIQQRITRTRRVFDRALRALPITQHHRIWPLYLEFVNMHDIPETALRVYRRYLKLCPENAEEFVEYLTRIGRLDDAAVLLADIVNKEDFVSKEGKSKHQLWNELCEMISKNPDKVHSLKVDAIIRGGLRRYTDQIGQLWNSLADYYIRAGLFERIINTFTEAVQTIDPKLATGKLNVLWVSFAKFYEENDQIEDARIIFEKATQVPFTKVEDLAHVWCEWAEMELRHENHEGALNLMQRATAMPSRKAAYHDQSEPVQFRVYKSLKVWSLYADLEESFGTFKSAKAVYDRIIDLKIATPQIIINYGLFLEENNYFEEAFKAYEKGIALFKWPNVFDIWNTYLTKFLKRYGGTKLERARDLFEQCLEGCPAKFAKALYLLYAKLEEEHGLARHAMAIYDRGCKAVLPEEQFETTADFWNTWKEFEVHHGNEDTMREMLRIKRSVQAMYNTQVNFMTAQMLSATAREAAAAAGTEGNAQKTFKYYNTKCTRYRVLPRVDGSGFAAHLYDYLPSIAHPSAFKGGTTEDEQNLAEQSRTTNPDEISIDDEDGSDDDQQVEEVAVEQRSVPEEVFGDLKK